MAKLRGPHLIQGHPIHHSGTAALGHAVTFMRDECLSDKLVKSFWAYSFATNWNQTKLYHSQLHFILYACIDSSFINSREALFHWASLLQHAVDGALATALWLITDSLNHFKWVRRTCARAHTQEQAQTCTIHFLNCLVPIYFACTLLHWIFV